MRMHLYVYFSTHALACCASAKPCQVQILERAAPVVSLRQIISAKAYVCQVQKLIFDQSLRFLYNIYID